MWLFGWLSIRSWLQELEYNRVHTSEGDRMTRGGNLESQGLGTKLMLVYNI